LKEEKIDPVGRGNSIVDPVRRFRRNRDAAAQRGGQIVIGNAVLNEVLQDGGNCGERKRSTHRVLSFRDLR